MVGAELPLHQVFIPAPIQVNGKIWINLSPVGSRLEDLIVFAEGSQMSVNLKQLSGIIQNNQKQVSDCNLTLFYKVQEMKTLLMGRTQEIDLNSQNLSFKIHPHKQWMNATSDKIPVSRANPHQLFNNCLPDEQIGCRSSRIEIL